MVTSLSPKAISEDDLSMSKALVTGPGDQQHCEWATRCPACPSRSGVLCVQGEITWFILSIDFVGKIIKGETKVPSALLFPPKVVELVVKFHLASG